LTKCYENRQIFEFLELAFVAYFLNLRISHISLKEVYNKPTAKQWRTHFSIAAAHSGKRHLF
jgi:hypothetical protein